jgi:hypothetical protein
MSAMPEPKQDVPITPGDPAEYQRFLDMARELGADEDPEAIDRAFDRIVSPKKITPSGSRLHQGEKPTSS